MAASQQALIFFVLIIPMVVVTCLDPLSLADLLKESNAQSEASMEALGWGKSASASVDRSNRKATARPTDLSLEEQSDIVDEHNECRRDVTPSAGNMKALEWDEDLAAMAQGWSDQCYFEHGNPENSSPFSSVGQNVYIRWTSKKNPSSPNVRIPVKRWDAERNQYNYTTGKCRGVCGHYKQVVWAGTTHVGCGRTFCERATNKKGKTYTNAWIVTCNYGPSGNVYSQKPYKEGDTCTQCSSPSTCKDGLCRECDLDDPGCSCDLLCENCGYTNTTAGSCECFCPRGFWGINCHKPCEDTHRYCRVSPGWPNRNYCKKHTAIPRGCPLMCGVCERADVDDDLHCGEGSQAAK